MDINSQKRFFDHKGNKVKNINAKNDGLRLEKV